MCGPATHIQTISISTNNCLATDTVSNTQQGRSLLTCAKCATTTFSLAEIDFVYGRAITATVPGQFRRSETSNFQECRRRKTLPRLDHESYFGCGGTTTLFKSLS
ncbi:hypothetical protein Plhal304r1_c017g0061551 [Plasmopara halstedii]